VISTKTARDIGQRVVGILWRAELNLPRCCFIRGSGLFCLPYFPMPTAYLPTSTAVSIPLSAPVIKRLFHSKIRRIVAG